MTRILSRLVAAAALVAGGLAITPGPAHAASTAVIAIESQWNSGYTAAVTVRNPGTTPISGWRVEFDLPAGTTLSNAWNVSPARSGGHYTLTPASWNAIIARAARPRPAPANRPAACSTAHPATAPARISRRRPRLRISA
jgi:hypothetical protein